MAKYKFRNWDLDGVAHQDILDQESTPNISIPKDSGNRHYQDYLEWVAAGNTTDPAD